MTGVRANAEASEKRTPQRLNTSPGKAGRTGRLPVSLRGSGVNYQTLRNWKSKWMNGKRRSRRRNAVASLG